MLIDAQTLLEATKGRLLKHKGRYAEICRETGISYSSLVQLAQGHADNPTVNSLQRVIEALDQFEGIERAPAPEAETP